MHNPDDCPSLVQYNSLSWDTASEHRERFQDVSWLAFVDPAEWYFDVHCRECGPARPAWSCCAPDCSLQLIEATPLECGCDTCGALAGGLPRWWGGAA